MDKSMTIGNVIYDTVLIKQITCIDIRKTHKNTNQLPLFEIPNCSPFRAYELKTKPRQKSK